LLDDQMLGIGQLNTAIMGVDYHPSGQYIAFLDVETGNGD
jgi:hypothetical protein